MMNHYDWITRFESIRKSIETTQQEDVSSQFCSFTRFFKCFTFNTDCKVKFTRCSRTLPLKAGQETHHALIFHGNRIMKFHCFGINYWNVGIVTALGISAERAVTYDVCNSIYRLPRALANSKQTHLPALSEFPLSFCSPRSWNKESCNP